MRLYVCLYNNGEAYEDNWEYICAIFDSKEKAIKFIKDNGYTELSPYSKNVYRAPEIKYSEEEAKRLAKLEDEYWDIIDNWDKLTKNMDSDEIARFDNEINEKYSEIRGGFWDEDDNSYYTIEEYELNKTKE